MGTMLVLGTRNAKKHAEIVEILDDLGLEQRLTGAGIEARQRFLTLLGRGTLGTRGGGVHGLGLKNFERQVQAWKVRIAIFQLGDDAQAVVVVLEAPLCLHALIERCLARQN